MFLKIFTNNNLYDEFRTIVYIYLENYLKKY